MTLAQFQASLAELIYSPRRLGAVRTLGSAALETSDLDELEQRRLVSLARDPHLEIAVILQLRRRLAAVLTALPHTCRLLGDAITSSLMREYRTVHPPRSSYFAEEGIAFADFLSTRSELTPFVADVLAFELAVLELDLEKEWESEAALQSVPPSPYAYPKLAPQSRLLNTRHEPEEIATVLRGGALPHTPTRRPRTMFLRRTSVGDLQVEVLEDYLASALRLCSGEDTIINLRATHGLSDDDFAALNEAGYVVFAQPR